MVIGLIVLRIAALYWLNKTKTSTKIKGHIQGRRQEFVNKRIIDLNTTKYIVKVTVIK